MANPVFTAQIQRALTALTNGAYGVNDFVFNAFTPSVTTAALYSPDGVTLYFNGSAINVGTGTVTSVSVTTANGVSGVVATPTTTPAITLTLGAITPTSVTAAAGTVTASTPVFSGTETWNAGAVSFRGSRLIVTDTASASTSRYFEILGGAAGTTDEFYVQKGGIGYFATKVLTDLIQDNGGAVAVSVGGVTAAFFGPNNFQIKPTSGLQISPADGIVAFAGTGVTHPALVASGTTLQAKLGDNSAGTTFTAATLQGNKVAGLTSAPAISGNGTLVAGSTDVQGKILATVTGAATITLTFGTAYAVAPSAAGSNETTANLASFKTTQTTLVITGVTVTGDAISYHVIGA